MKTFSVLALGVLASSMLAACGQEQTPGVAHSPTAAKTESSQVSQVEKATLEVVPGTVDSCELGATIDPTVSWQRIDPAVKSTKVTTDNPANPQERLFAKAGFGGSAKAGNWVVAGTRFHVYDDVTGSVLASYTVKMKETCAK